MQGVGLGSTVGVEVAVAVGVEVAVAVGVGLGDAVTVVFKIAVLFVISGSIVSLMTVAAFGMGPGGGAVTVTTIVIIAVSPKFIVPNEQLTVVIPKTIVSVQLPNVVEADTNEVPKASGSLTVTLLAASGPLFFTPSV